MEIAGGPWIFRCVVWGGGSPSAQRWLVKGQQSEAPRGGDLRTEPRVPAEWRSGVGQGPAPSDRGRPWNVLPAKGSCQGGERLSGSGAPQTVVGGPRTAGWGPGEDALIGTVPRGPTFRFHQPVVVTRALRTCANVRACHYTAYNTSLSGFS